MRNAEQGDFAERHARVVLLVIVIIYLILGGLYAVETPAWQVPDEPAHYNYVKYLAEQGKLPELTQGNYPHEYLEEIKARRFPPEMSIERIRYEAHQPPLYYLLAAAVYRIVSLLRGMPLLLALRGFSLLLGAATLVTIYGLVRTIYPREPVLALGTSALAATLPMHLATTAGVNNDVLAELLLTLIVWQLVAMTPRDWTVRKALGLGALLGMATLTKMQSYIGFGVALLALGWDAVSHGDSGQRLDWRVALGRAGIMVGTALAMAAPWLIRNMIVYGPADPMALVRHDQVVVGQLTTREYLAQHGFLALLRDFLTTSFRSFWGQFGWMGVLLDQRIYLALALLSGLAALGFALYLARLRGQTHPLHRRTRRGLAFLALWAILTILGYLWWNTKYVQHQGRYLFPALVPWGLGFTLGLREVLRGPPQLVRILLGLTVIGLLVLGLAVGDIPGFGIALVGGAWVALEAGRWMERRWAGSAMAVVYLGMADLSMVCLYGYVVPALQL